MNARKEIKKIENLLYGYTIFSMINKNNEELIHVVTPFFSRCKNHIIVYINLENKTISDDKRTMLDAVNKKQLYLMKKFIAKKQSYCKDLIVFDKEIMITGYTAEKLIPFIQLLIEINGFIDGCYAIVDEVGIATSDFYPNGIR